MKKFELGELFIIGFKEKDVSDSLRSKISEYCFGGVILFSRNLVSFEQWRRLTDDLQTIRSEPIFIAIDEEGGSVSRMPIDEYTLPGARAIAETGESQTVYECAQTVGAALSYLGCNVNFAPVLDVNVNPLNPGIGIRSYGEDTVNVAKFGASFIDGMNDNRILCCAKHFPGKGDIIRDSHKELPVCESSKEAMESVHIFPFRKAIERKVPFVMTSHAVYPVFDQEKLPGTFSKNILQKYLREKLKFTGLIVSDDLEMGALESFGHMGERAYRAIMAGCDLILICHDENKQKSAYEYLQNKLSTDQLFKKRCIESYERIIEMKRKLVSSKTDFNLENLKELSYQISSKVIKCVKDDNGLIPISKDLKKILVAGAELRSDVEVEIIGRTPYGISDLYSSVKNRFMCADFISWDINPSKKQIQSATDKKYEQYDLILLFTNNANLFPLQQEIIKTILETFLDKTILIPVKNPEDADIFNAGTIVQTFGYNKTNIVALERFLFS